MSDTLTVRGWSGCPTTSGVEAWVQRVCADAGVPAPALTFEWVETDAEAVELAFPGSPTFVREGVDLFLDPAATPSLTCRLYRTRDGRPSPLPDPEDFIAALRSS